MDEDGYGSSGVWNIWSDISLDDVVISVYYWDYLQVGLFAVSDYFSTGVNCYLDQFEDL